MRRKGRNGVGLSITVTFDKHDNLERKAQEMSCLLASKHGRRKNAIVALLAAMYDYYEQTGELMTATAIQNAITGAGNYTPMEVSFNAAPSPYRPLNISPRSFEPQPVELQPSVSRGENSANPAQKWLQNMSSLFD